MAAEFTIGSKDNISRAEHAYDSLKAMLNDGRLRPGQRLREVELAEMLDVSRTPVREALRRIVADGLIEFQPGRGIVVVEYDKQQVQELYGLRGLLEGGAAAFAARHASKSELEIMRSLLERSAGLFESPQDTMRINAQFHQAIHGAAHNRYLEQALVQMSASLALLPGTTFSEPGRAAIALEEHRAVLDAIERGDPAEAERLARSHIEMAGAARMRMMFATGT